MNLKQLIHSYNHEISQAIVSAEKKRKLLRDREERLNTPSYWDGRERRANEAN